jgi:hypothetical protein
MEDKRRYYVYKYYDNWDNILYVGQTVNPSNRYVAHKNESPWHKEHVHYVVAEVPNKSMMDIYELYLINKLNPPNNKANARNDEMAFDLPPLDFKEWVFPPKPTKPKRPAIKEDHDAMNKLKLDTLCNIFSSLDSERHALYDNHYVLENVDSDTLDAINNNCVFTVETEKSKMHIGVVSYSEKDIETGINTVTINLNICLVEFASIVQKLRRSINS